MVLQKPKVSKGSKKIPSIWEAKLNSGILVGQRKKRLTRNLSGFRKNQEIILETQSQSFKEKWFPKPKEEIKLNANGGHRNR